MSEERWRLRCPCHFLGRTRATDTRVLITETPVMDGDARRPRVSKRNRPNARDVRGCVGGA